ncbi:MAG TPA: T9SS type A sorting domain-containing protein [Bacteroidales bacterium]|nr:T9SS type A sorting domain-containing protein [Bacteroidales bacterium]HPS61485.1 T9SS type A sorting domain-containing protein [Bacteroidales bacterium]
MENPHIVADNANHLHVTYDFNTGDYTATKIAYIHFDGSTWSAPVFISDSLPGPAMHNRLAIDHNDKVYCFWFRGNIVYRTMENGMWGNYYQPYSSIQHFIMVNRAEVNSGNDLYCIGYHHYQGQTSYDDRAVAFSLEDGQWSSLQELSDTLTWDNCDVGLIGERLPVYTWGQLRKGSAINHHVNFYCETTPSGMTPPTLLSEDAYEVALTTDINGHMHIVDTEKISDSLYHLVHYSSEQVPWSTSIIANGNIVYSENQLKSVDSSLYLVTLRMEILHTETLSVVFFRRKIRPIGHEEIRPITCSVFPNPFSGSISVRINATSNEPLHICLTDNLGRVAGTLFQGRPAPGTFTVTTDCRNWHLRPGIYMVQVRSASLLTTQKVVYLPGNFLNTD